MVVERRAFEEWGRLVDLPSDELGGIHALGVKIRTDRLVGVVVNVHGQIVERAEFPGGLASLDHQLQGTDVETVIHEVAALVGELSGLHSDFGQPVGLGVELSGQVNGNTGMVQWSHRMGWYQPVPLAALLQRATGHRTMVEHDVKALALDEQVFGLGQGRRSFAVVTAGLGIGAGLVINHQLWRGVSGTAGELGHMVVEPSGRSCPCGNQGCLETVAGSGGIILALQEAGHSDIQDLHDASELARNGDAVARGAFEHAGELLGRGLSWLANLLNLELIVVRADPALRRSGLYEEAAKRSFSENGFYQATQECKLEILDHDHRLGARSAGSMVFRLLSDHGAELNGEED
jgi:glucokinase